MAEEAKSAEEAMPPREEISAAAAAAALERDRRERQAACVQDIQEALRRHNCELRGAFMWADGQGEVRIQIVARSA